MASDETRSSKTRRNREQPAVRVERLSGLGRVLITVYIVLALAATFRSIYQILTKFDEAPIAYSLSAVSGVVYIVAVVALIKRRGVWRAIAWAALIFELCGVLVVGALSLLVPQLFDHPSVWSYFGRGYVFIPLVLPMLGLLWLRLEGNAVRSAEGIEPGVRSEDGVSTVSEGGHNASL